MPPHRPWVRKKPLRLLTQNSEVKDDGSYNWTLPAWVTTLDDGRRINVCPEADACVNLCYARQGFFQMPAVAAAHRRNLTLLVDHPDRWQRLMLSDLHHPRLQPTGQPRTNPSPPDGIDPWLTRWWHNGGRAVRIHDSGDFFTDDYLARWVGLARAAPHVLLYAYTKAVARVRRVAPNPPDNLRFIYSLGGAEDHLLDLDHDRHADVFPDEPSLDAAGYTSQDASDLLCISLPTTRVGIPQNNLAAVKKRLGDRTFSDVQHERDAKRHGPIPATRPNP